MVAVEDGTEEVVAEEKFEEVAGWDETKEVAVEEKVEGVAGSDEIEEVVVEEKVEGVVVDMVVEVAVVCVLVAWSAAVGVPLPFVSFLPWWLVLGGGQGHIHVGVG